jgi:hypothetical protein
MEPRAGSLRVKPSEALQGKTGSGQRINQHWPMISGRNCVLCKDASEGLASLNGGFLRRNVHVIGRVFDVRVSRLDLNERD